MRNIIRDTKAINYILKNKDGITLIVLIITIIILLILAGVTIMVFNNENGLFIRAKQAKENTTKAQEDENTIIDGYENEIDKYTVGISKEEINSSEVISNVNLIVDSIGTTTVECKVNIECDNIEDIADYHIYVENLTTSKKKVYIGKEKNINLDGLVANTKYRIYAIACDIYGKFKKTINIEIQTLDAEPLIIDSIRICNPYWGKYSVNVAGCTQILFNKIIKETSMPYSGILMAGSDYIEISVNKNIKIFAYGGSYADGGGSSGKQIIVKKLNNDNYEEYKVANTDSSGNRYELLTLETGKYRIYIAGNYVNFTEWEVGLTN